LQVEPPSANDGVRVEASMPRYIPDEIEAYSERFTSDRFDLFDRLAAETRESQTAPHMMVGVVEGAFLSFLVAVAQASRVLEVGTFTGWSSIAMARALPPGGTLVTCDIDEETTAIARRYAEEAGVADRIDYRVGPAVETLATLDGPFDFAFIDADKPGYVDYYEAILPKLSEHGFIGADNTLFGLDGDTENARAITRFNEHVVADDRVEAVLLPIREGLTLIRRR
jgi:caffeoyl-CoA O-methyltransferase